MEAHYAILGLQKLNTVSQIQMVSLHNLRQRVVSNADPKRRGLNRLLFGSTSIVNDYRSKMAQMGLQEDDLRKNAVRAIELVLAFSPSWVRDEQGNYVSDARQKLICWVKLSTKWLHSQFGKNVLNIVLHGDESNYHLHCVCGVGYWNERWQKYRLSADRLVGSPSKLRALHTAYADSLAGIGLKRGREQSPASHQTLKEFYHQVNEAKAKANKVGLVGPGKATPESLQNWEQSLAKLSDDVDIMHQQKERALQNEVAYWKAKYHETLTPKVDTNANRPSRPNR
jgi:hypothetical protein